MQKQRPASINGVSGRLRRLRAAFGVPTQTAMAERLGVKVDRYRKAETTGVLSTGLAVKIITTFGVPRGWLYDGATGDMTMSMAQRLGELPRAAEGRSTG